MSSEPSGGPSAKGTDDSKSRPRDLIKRGVYKSSPLGTATFVGLRALDPFLQYQILARGLGTGLLSKLGLATIPVTATAFIPTGNALLDGLGLPLPRLILLAMAAGSAAKHIFWLTYTCREEFPPGAAVAVSGYNTFVNSVNSLLLITAATSSALAAGPDLPVPFTGCAVSLPVAIGTVLYVAGIAVETVSELQRKRFKEQPGNEGRVCSDGLWGFSRHVNYAAYAVWRTGYTLAAGGWPAALVMGAFQVWDFSSRSVAVMDEYMGSKYGEQWKKYKADVPWVMFPGLY